MHPSHKTAGILAIYYVARMPAISKQVAIRIGGKESVESRKGAMYGWLSAGHNAT